MLYQDINKLLSVIHSDFTAAESHGMAAGLMCVNDHAKPEFWLEELTQGVDEINDEEKSVLLNLFEDTRRLLANEDFSFTLLLPDEDMPLSGQLEALREWCQGFLYGLGCSVPEPDWSEDCMEIVKDITEFTKLEVEADGEEAENAFMELTEYLRTSVVFLYSELNAASKGRLH